MYIPSPTEAKFTSSGNTTFTASSFCRLKSQDGQTLLVLGELFSLGNRTFSGPQDPDSLFYLFESLIENPGKTWSSLEGQCSCVWVTPDRIEAFRSKFSPHLLFFKKNHVSDQLRTLISSKDHFSDEYAQKYVLDQPSIQFSSLLTPIQNIFRVPPASFVSLTHDSEPQIHLLPTSPYTLMEGNQSLEETAHGLRETLRRVLEWHLKKKKPVASELSGGLDSSFVASFLADLSTNEIDGLMYAYRKHPSHRFSENCARVVALEKTIALKVVDSSEMPPVNLTVTGPYQNEPIDFFWQGAIFGPVYQSFVKPHSLLFTGFGADQILMRSHLILRSIFRKKGIFKTLSWVRDIARSLNRPTVNFYFQFFVSILPKTLLIQLLDLTRNLTLNPFKIDELMPDIARLERISWFVKDGKPLSVLSLSEIRGEGEALEERFFEPLLPHANLNYLVAPQYVTQPYLSPKEVEYIHPFCDSRLLDFVFRNVPFKWIHDFKNPYKHLLRESMHKITPEEIRLRKRDEFSFDGYFFQFLKTNEGFLRELLEESISAYPTWIDAKSIRTTFESLLFGVSNHSVLALTRLMSYCVWKRYFQTYLNQTSEHCP